MADVFISYSRANQEMVRHLAEAVKRLGYSVWWDDELPPHRSYSDVITEKIGEAKAAIVVWSGGSIGSEWVRAEADLARNQKKLIQTAIDECMPPMPFNQIQFASLAGWQGEDGHPGWTKVKASLAALCGAATDNRPAYPLPEAPPPVTMTQRAAPAPPRRSNMMLGALIGGSLVVLAGVGVLALTRGGSPAPAPAPPGQSAAPSAPPPPAPPKAQTAAAPRPQPARPAAARTPATTHAAPARAQPQPQPAAMPARVRRYCMNHMAECMQMRRARRY
jgi:hypothetical protein